jgi:hypothetical protein
VAARSHAFFCYGIAFSLCRPAADGIHRMVWPCKCAQLEYDLEAWLPSAYAAEIKLPAGVMPEPPTDDDGAAAGARSLARLMLLVLRRGGATAHTLRNTLAPVLGVLHRIYSQPYIPHVERSSAVRLLVAVLAEFWHFEPSPWLGQLLTEVHSR